METAGCFVALEESLGLGIGSARTLVLPFVWVCVGVHLRVAKAQRASESLSALADLHSAHKLHSHTQQRQQQQQQRHTSSYGFSAFPIVNVCVQRYFSATRKRQNKWKIANDASETKHICILRSQSKDQSTILVYLNFSLCFPL